MAGVNLNKKTFRLLIILMGAAALILVGIILILQFNVPALIMGFFAPAAEPDTIVTENETGPWGYKEFQWEYRGITNTIGVTITNGTYKENYEPFGGTNIPADLINYVVTDDADYAVSDISSQLAALAESNGFDDSETIKFVLSFVRSITYQTDSEYVTDTKYTRSLYYPRAPVVTLAEQTGDSEDLSILVSAILKSMGYASALYYYPASYDRHTAIPQACALALIGTSDSAPFYAVNTTWTAENVTFRTDKKLAVSAPSGFENSSGWYIGNGTWTSKNDNGTMNSTKFAPSSLEFTAEDVPYISGEAAVCTIENPKWVMPVKTEWLVDTSLKGISVSAYNSKTPVIIQDDSLWSGKEGTAEEKEKLDLELAFDLGLSIEKPKIFSNISSVKYWNHGIWFENPIQSPIYVSETATDPGTEIWREESQEYLESSWYPSGVSWSYNYDKWNLYEHFLTINEIPSVLYTPAGTAEFTTQTPWRITYSVTDIYEPMKLDPDGDFMTPYADLCIAVYNITDEGIELVEMTGWQGHSNARKYGISNVYSPGKYAVGVFSRNALASVTVEYHGKEPIVSYKGGI